MKTQLDIDNSAVAAASAALEVTGTYEIERMAMEVFQAEKQDPLDWEMWKGRFDQERNRMLRLREAKAPSEQAKAAAKGA